jgi:hypothetical protein
VAPHLADGNHDPDTTTVYWAMGMKKQISTFLITLCIVVALIGVVFLLSGRLNMAIATMVAGATGPFSGLFWTNNVNPGLAVVGLGLASVIGVWLAGHAIFKQADARRGIAGVCAIIWFGFGAYGIPMLA